MLEARETWANDAGMTVLAIEVVVVVGETAKEMASARTATPAMSSVSEASWRLARGQGWCLPHRNVYAFKS